MNQGDRVSIKGIRVGQDEKDDDGDFFRMELPNGKTVSAIEEKYFDGCAGNVVKVWPSSIFSATPVVEVEIQVKMILLCREEEIASVESDSDKATVFPDGFPP